MFDSQVRLCVDHITAFSRNTPRARGWPGNHAQERAECEKPPDRLNTLHAGRGHQLARCQAPAERLQPREKLFAQDQISEPYSTCCTWVLLLQYMRRPDGASYRRHGSETHQHQTSPKRPTRLWHAGSSQVRAILLCERSAASD